MRKIPLIIDTDFTKDDIIAIKLLADSDKYDIKAITCYGEWFVETVQLRNSMGLDCPVCWGAMKPLFRPEISENVYGNTSPDTTEKVRIEENPAAFAAYFAQYAPKHVAFEFLPYHEYGKDKWQTPYQIKDGFVSDEILETFRRVFTAYGLTLIKT